MNDSHANEEPLQEMGPYERKWKSLFEENVQMFGDEELDYEYTNEDYQAAEDLPLTYNWSPSGESSPSSSRSPSPVIINLTDEEDDEYLLVQKSLKKLTREFNKIYNFKTNTISPATRKTWKRNIDYRGVLTRWRIRSLDTIFLKSTERYVARIPQRMVNIQTDQPSDTRERPESEIAEVSIVFDNNLCTNNQEGEPIPNMANLPPLRRISVVYDNGDQHGDAPPQLDRFDQADEGPSSSSVNLVDFLPEKYSETQYMAVRNNNGSGMMKGQFQKRIVNSSTLQRFMNLQTPLSAPPSQEHLFQRHSFLSNGTRDVPTFAASHMAYTHYPYPPPHLPFSLSLPPSYRLPYPPRQLSYPRSNDNNNAENEYHSSPQ